MRKLSLFVLAVSAFLHSSDGFALEKIKYGTSIKDSPVYYLPILAAEEKGIWKQNGLEGEWVPFKGGALQHRAYAAGAVKIGSTIAAASLQSASRGVPLTIVAGIQADEDYRAWVRTDSRFKRAEDLADAKFGTSRFGGSGHAYIRIIAKSLGAERTIKVVATGGVPEALASFQRGTVDVLVLTPHQLINLQLAGIAKPLLRVNDYLPKPWAGYVIDAQRDFARNAPETARKIIKSVLQANGFVMTNREWAINTLIKMGNYPAEAARLVYESLSLSTDGKIGKEEILNVRMFLLDYGIIRKEEAPSIDEVFTDRFIS